MNALTRPPPSLAPIRENGKPLRGDIPLPLQPHGVNVCKGHRPHDFAPTIFELPLFMRPSRNKSAVVSEHSPRTPMQMTCPERSCMAQLPNARALYNHWNVRHFRNHQPTPQVRGSAAMDLSRWINNDK